VSDPPFRGRERGLPVESLDDRRQLRLGGVGQPLGVGGDSGHRPDDVVDDRDVRDPRRSREGVEVDHDLDFPHRVEGLRPVAVLQGDEDDVGRVDAVGVDFRPLVVERREPCVGLDPADPLRAVCTEVVGDRPDALGRPVEEVDFEVGVDDRGELDDLPGDERGDVAVDREDGAVGEQQLGGGGSFRAVGARNRLLTQ